MLDISAEKLENDFLKKVIVTYINDNNIDVWKLDEEPHSLHNLVHALKSDNILSANLFNKWRELLGIKFNISFYDHKGYSKSFQF